MGKRADGNLSPKPSFRRLNWAQTIFVAFSLRVSIVAGSSSSFAQAPIGECVNKSKILPDLIDTVPTQRLFIEYGKYRVDFGTYLSPITVEFPPTNLEWLPTRNKYYTLILTDPDFPTPESPNKQEWQHWIVGNIPPHDIIDGKPVGGNFSDGEILTEYFGVVSWHRFGTPHRYVFLLYEHDHKVKFDEPYVKHIADDFYRADFSSREFAKKYNLGKPFGVNYFYNTRDPRNLDDNRYSMDSYEDSKEEEEGQEDEYGHEVEAEAQEIVLTTSKSHKDLEGKLAGVHELSLTTPKHKGGIGGVHELVLTTPKSKA